MNTIALVYGGKSLESEVSVLTALKIKEGINKEKYHYLLVYLDQNNNFYVGDGLNKLDNYISKKGFKKARLVNKNNKHYFQTLNKKYYFDDVLILGHGKNIEDGKVHSYFEMQNINVYGHNEEASFLMQNKHLFSLYIKALKIPTLSHILIHKNELDNNYEKIKERLIKEGFPLIVKGVRLGSSIGVYVINNQEEIEKSLNMAFLFDNDVIVEKYLKNKIEVNIALLGYEQDIICSDFEIVNTSTEILGFNDKYDYSYGNVKRKVTSLNDEKISNRIKEYSKKIFLDLGLCGVVRFDFMIDVETEKIYLNEVNSIPGSLAYYLFENKGLELKDVITKIIDFGKKKCRNEKLLKTKYDDDFLFSSPLRGLKNKMSL